MKKLVVIIALVFCFTATAQAGWLDKVKEAGSDAVKQSIPGQTTGAAPASAPQGAAAEPAKQGSLGQPGEAAKPSLPSASPAISGISPDQADANACTQYIHEDWKKSEKALKESKLTWGSSRYLPKKEWIDYLKTRYPNMKRVNNDFYVHFGKWYGKSCAYVTLTCRPKEPGCDAQMKCLDSIRGREARPVLPTCVIITIRNVSSPTRRRCNSYIAEILQEQVAVIAADGRQG